MLLFLQFQRAVPLTESYLLPTTANHQTEVAVFIALDCPISQKYISTLNDIYLKYKNRDQFKWSFIVPGKGSKKKIKAFINEYDVKFPLKADGAMLRRTKYFKASVTPEVVMMKYDKMIYRGAIDNWFYELGRYRSIINEHYLIDALESVLNNKEPVIKETQAIGCFIQKSHKK